MRTRTRLIAVAFAAASFLGGAFAHASACDPRVLLMSDGRFYHPSSGQLSDTCEGMLTLIGGAPAPATTSGPRAAVEKARAMIQERIKELNEGKNPEHAATMDVWIDITLAIWNQRTGDVRLVEAEKNGAAVRADIPVTVHRNNGVNSEFRLEDPDDVIVGVRYPIFNSVPLSVCRSKFKNVRKECYELQDVLYVPYSAKLHTPEMVAWGKETLDANVRKAYDDYRAAGIRSRAFPDRLLVDVISAEQLETIAIIEHVSDASLLGANSLRILESVYVVLGGNQDDAYAYSRSSMGAKGLFQFIPSTYKLMTARKDLGLDPEFETGMAEPVNAIKAAVAYLDAELAGMPLAVKDLYYVNNDRVIEYLAAAYNGGGTRVRRAVLMWGDSWSEPHANDIAALTRKKGARSLDVTRMKNATLRDETIGYVKKLRQALTLLRPSPLARM